MGFRPLSANCEAISVGLDSTASRRIRGNQEIPNLDRNLNCESHNSRKLGGVSIRRSVLRFFDVRHRHFKAADSFRESGSESSIGLCGDSIFKSRSGPQDETDVLSRLVHSGDRGLRGSPGGEGAPITVRLVVIRATEVVAAVGANQLAAMAGKPVGAGGADLAVVLYGLGILKRADCGR